MHSHSDMTLLEDGDAPSKIRQGVTTEVLGEDTSAGPAKGKRTPASSTSSGKTHDLDDARRLLRRPRAAGHRRQRRQLRRPRQRSGTASWATRFDRPDAGAARRDEDAARRGDARRGARPVDHAGRAPRAGRHDRRPRRALPGRHAARRHLSRRTSATKGPASSTRSRRRSPSASGPACRSTSSTSRSPTRSSGAG